MGLSVWLAFVATAIGILVIPGPTISLVMSYALSQGSRAAAAIVAGVALGDLTAMSLSLVGLGALLATSATLFTALKWIGATYLVYLGIKLWRAPLEAADTTATTVPAKVMFGHAWLVTALNPKSIVFFVAFVPQFIDPHRPYLPQALILIATFVVLAAANAGAYALVASRLKSAIRRPSVQRWVNRTGGTVLVGAGVAAVAWKRTG
ncbi:MAG TPA: LysE family translocator [Geminicoccus sp.]|jgi:threonine/homoserine/homoserine lactone efflux protein|uniref:LysE family translocator n=1 Tax=Geminicoccus sp. TaxID=2024832 RepID=UPI002E2FC420|nr:LysE family translocator [Geminicoccus sp.]HEX2527564.1 LysE family translocator [Geminicoccus sp.]